MLALSLILSLLGFLALLVALYVGSTVWAWVCVVVGLVGIVLFIADLIAMKRR